MTSLRRAALASLITVLLLALALPVSPVAAQGLGAAAARERAKRAKQAGGPEGAGKTFSNEDLDYMPNQGNGQAVAVIGIPADATYRRNPAILQAYHQSLQAMCYPGPYVPIEQRNYHGQ